MAARWQRSGGGQLDGRGGTLAEAQLWQQRQRIGKCHDSIITYLITPLFSCCHHHAAMLPPCSTDATTIPLWCRCRPNTAVLLPPHFCHHYAVATTVLPCPPPCYHQAAAIATATMLPLPSPPPPALPSCHCRHQAATIAVIYMAR